MENMSFDSTCRRLAEQFPQDFVSWLLGKTLRTGQQSQSVSTKTAAKGRTLPFAAVIN
jgi:predicted transposase YdaD